MAINDVARIVYNMDVGSKCFQDSVCVFWYEKSWRKAGGGAMEPDR